MSVPIKWLAYKNKTYKSLTLIMTLERLQKILTAVRVG